MFGGDLAAHLGHGGAGGEADADIGAEHLVHHLLELGRALGAAKGALAPEQFELAFFVGVFDHAGQGRRPLRSHDA